MAAIPANAGARRACDRFLSPAEVKAFWAWLVAYQERSLIASAVLLRIATGQRSEEILRITADTYDRAKGDDLLA